MARRSYAGGAQPTTLASSVNSTTTILSAVALVGWPVPTHPFFAVIDRDTPNEEKVLCQSVNGNDITVLRGQDGTTARDHSAGAPFEHCHTATDADEANAHANAVAGVHGVPVGDGFVFRDAAQTLKNKTLDFGVAGGNQATNIPPSAAPQITDLIAAEATARQAGDQLNADAIAAHETAADPHPQYLTQPEGAALITAAVPPGTVAMFAGPAAPAGWLLCNGATVSRAAYGALFTAIQTTYGAGDGSTTFGLPDFSGRVPRGTGSNGTNGISGTPTTYGLNGSGGLDSRAITAGNLPKHQHTLNQHTHAFSTGANQGSHTHPINIDRTANADPHRHSYVNAAAGGVGTTVTDPNEAGVVGTGTGTYHTHSGTTSNNAASTLVGDGGFANTPVDTRDPFRGIHFIIKT